jgi:hypothetical protein
LNPRKHLEHEQAIVTVSLGKMWARSLWQVHFTGLAIVAVLVTVEQHGKLCTDKHAHRNKSRFPSSKCVGVLALTERM